MRHKLAFVTIDPDNATEFVERGLALGFDVEVWQPRDGMPTLGEADAVVYDSDSLAPDRRSREDLVKQLLSRSGRRLLAVHGYNLDDHQETLTDHGVIVARKMDEKFFGAIALRLARPQRRQSRSPWWLTRPARREASLSDSSDSGD